LPRSPARKSCCFEAIDEGTEKAAAFEIRQELAPDFGSDVP
jgi:hypothetical protein